MFRHTAQEYSQGVPADILSKILNCFYKFQRRKNVFIVHYTILRKNLIQFTYTTYNSAVQDKVGGWGGGRRGEKGGGKEAGAWGMSSKKE